MLFKRSDELDKQKQSIMKKNKIIYIVSTALICLVMIFSMYKMFTPDYERLSLPHYLRTELLILKIAGLLVLTLPQFSARVKEWAYAGFGITLISAFVAHYSSGDSLARSLDPMVFFVILIVSNIYLYKTKKLTSQ